MKKPLIILITIILSSTSCKEEKYNKEEYPIEEIKYEIRKYIVAEDLLYITNTNYIEDLEIKIDSITQLLKYNYLENELLIAKTTYENHLTSTDEKNLVWYLSRDLIEKKIDSLTIVYNVTTKDENYFKCYVSLINKKTQDIFTQKLVLDEVYKPIDYFYY